MIFVILTPVIVCSFVTSQDIYQNQFAIYVPKGHDVASQLASKYGFVNMGQIGDLTDYYLFDHPRIRKRSTESATLHSIFLTLDPNVKWFEQQKILVRRKRDEKYNLTMFPDPMFASMWHLNGGARGGFDMNVLPAWNKGYSGKGVVITILDDGIQHNHPDLIDNYDSNASMDINGNDLDPMPTDNGDNKHGTRCAGEVAASANNGVCGVGIAYSSSIGGVRMLDGVVNDAVEARALSLNPDHIDIYSASWGPEDDGKTVDGPGPLAKRAFLNGVIRGRGGKGSIFVWASGNGGRYFDNCNCDGYTNSIFTLSISSATQGGFRPWYLEECSSTLATTYSSGTPGTDGSIYTVDQDAQLRESYLCTSQHTGTSASAPIAAAVCALALEANPQLTWRDMQHLVIKTSRPEPLKDEPGWHRNGAGMLFSHKFGFGLMDAEQMVDKGKYWTLLPEQRICQTSVLSPKLRIPDSFASTVSVTVSTDGCYGGYNAVRYLEHVQCKVSLRYYPRGNLMLTLISPSGTRSTLLFPRPKDIYASSFSDWPFLSVHFWGETPNGEWKLEIANMGHESSSREKEGILKKWQLIFYGTSDIPYRVPRAEFFPLANSFPSLFTLGPIVQKR